MIGLLTFTVGVFAGTLIAVPIMLIVDRRKLRRRMNAAHETIFRALREIFRYELHTGTNDVIQNVQDHERATVRMDITPYKEHVHAPEHQRNEDE